MPNLQSQLTDWLNRVYNSNSENINNNYRFFFDHLKNIPLIQSVLQSAIDKSPVTDEQMEEYRSLFSSRIYRNVEGSQEHQTAVLYKFHLFLLERKVKMESLMRGYGSDFKEGKNRFLDLYVRPIINYLIDQINESNSVLYLLEKYKIRTEWFLHKDLLGKYNEAKKSYEQIFEDDLRLYLFDQGINNPFSQPKSSSGRADIVGLIDTKDPLILEIKIYDSGRNYKKDRIIDGFSAIVQYSHDYNKNIGYLVIFNLDNIEIEISSEDADNTFPNKVNFNNKIYYILIINLNFGTPASKVGNLKVEKITKQELICNIH